MVLSMTVTASEIFFTFFSSSLITFPFSSAMGEPIGATDLLVVRDGCVLIFWLRAFAHAIARSSTATQAATSASSSCPLETDSQLVLFRSVTEGNEENDSEDPPP